MDLFQIKHPGMWDVGVPHPLGCSGSAGCLTARTKFVGHHSADSSWARTTLWKRWQKKAGTPKGLIMPQNKCEGSAGEKYHRQEFWQRAVLARARGNGEGGGNGKLPRAQTSASSVSVSGAGTGGEEPFPGEGTRGKQQLQPLRPRAAAALPSPGIPHPSEPGGDIPLPWNPPGGESRSSPRIPVRRESPASLCSGLSGILRIPQAAGGGISGSPPPSGQGDPPGSPHPSGARGETGGFTRRTGVLAGPFGSSPIPHLC